ASAPAAIAMIGRAVCNVASPASPAASAPPTTKTAHIGASASSLPATMAHRSIGRDHRYAAVRASTSSPIDDATNIGGRITSTSCTTRNTASPLVEPAARKPPDASAGTSAITSAIHTSAPRVARLNVTRASADNAAAVVGGLAIAATSGEVIEDCAEVVVGRG